MPSKVFVVHEPLDKDLGRTKDLTPAKEFGELVYCIRSGPTPNDLTGLIPRLAACLEDFTDEDYILPIGHPVLIGWVTALACRKTNGKVKMLYWRQGIYTAISADLVNFY